MNGAFPHDGMNFYGVIVAVREHMGRILYKVRVPQLHGKGVSDDHLPYVQANMPATGAGDSTSGGALDIGTAINFFKGPGQGSTGFGTITGLFQPVNEENKHQSGETNSISAAYAAYEATERAVRLPPDLKKILNDKGVEITEMVEKGAFSLAKLYDTATHGAIPPLNGAMIPEVRSIPTALQSAGSTLSASATAGLPGTNFSIGSLLDLMPNNIKTKLFDTLPKGVGNALKTLTTMAPKFEAGNFGNMGISGKRVNPEVLIANAVKLLSDVKNADDLIPVLAALMTDSTLSGGSELNHFITTFNGFGKTITKILGDGSIESVMDSESIKNLASFDTVMKGLEGTEGHIFDTVKDLPGMLDRMVPEVASTITTVLGKIADESPALRAANFVKG